MHSFGSSTPPLIEVSRALSRATIWHEDFASRNDFYSTPFNPPSPRGATLFTARTRSMDHHRRNTYTCLLRVSSLLSLSTATRHHGFTLSLFRMWRAININEAGWSLQRNKGRNARLYVCLPSVRDDTEGADARVYSLGCVHKIYRLETQSRLDG